jgi:hypothetical protein
MRTKENKFVYKLTEIRPPVAFCNGNMQEGGNAYAKRKPTSPVWAAERLARSSLIAR